MVTEKKSVHQMNKVGNKTDKIQQRKTHRLHWFLITILCEAVTIKCTVKKTSGKFLLSLKYLPPLTDPQIPRFKTDAVEQ